MASVPGDDQMANENAAYVQRMLALGQQGTQVNTVNPLGSQVWSTDANGNRTLTSQYAPGVQQDFDATLGQRKQARDLYGAAAGNVGATMANGGYNTKNVAGGVQYGTDPSTLMTGFSRDSFQGIPGASDFQGNQQKVEDALYGRSTARLDPQFAKAQSDMETKLRNQGFQAGDTGFNDVQNNLDTAKNDAYSSARNDAISGGQAVASNLLADALRIRGTQNAEGQQDLTNYDTTAGQNFAQRSSNVAQNNAARQQAIAEYLSNSTVPLAQMQAVQNGLPSNPLLPNFGSGTTGLAQANSPSFLDFTKTGASNQQQNDNRNTQIGSAVAGGVANAVGDIAGNIDWGSIFG